MVGRWGRCRRCSRRQRKETIEAEEDMISRRIASLYAVHHSLSTSIASSSAFSTMMMKRQSLETASCEYIIHFVPYFYLFYHMYLHKYILLDTALLCLLKDCVEAIRTTDVTRKEGKISRVLYQTSNLCTNPTLACTQNVL